MKNSNGNNKKEPGNGVSILQKEEVPNPNDINDSLHFIKIIYTPAPMNQLSKRSSLQHKTSVNSSSSKHIKQQQPQKHKGILKH